MENLLDMIMNTLKKYLHIVHNESMFALLHVQPCYSMRLGNYLQMFANGR